MPSFTRAVALVAAASALCASSASAEQFPSQAAAAAAGDPAGTGAARPAPNTAVFEGATLSLKDIQAKAGALRCVTDAPEKGGTTRCYRTAEQLQAAARGGVSTARARLRDCGFYEIQIHWEYGTVGTQSGNSYGFQGRTYWQNLPSYMNNDTSAYTMGDRPGHMAEDAGGGGYWYPGPTGLCNSGSITYGSYPSWDNRISSGWRTL